MEETFHVNKFVSLGFTGYYYWISNYENLPGYSLVGILRPRITLKLFSNTSIGVEHHVYYISRYLNKVPSLHLTRTEQKFFLQIFLEDRKRRGKYH